MPAESFHQQDVDGATSRLGPPPLRIYHLLACSAVAAVHFSLWKLANPYSLENTPVSYAWAMWAAIDVIRQSLHAIGLTGAIFSIYWYVKGYVRFTQPGQWLLLSCVFSAMELYWRVLYLGVLGPDLNDAARNLQASGVVSWILTVASIAIHFGPVPVYGWCAWSIADSLPWRLTFVALALNALVFPLSIVLLQFYVGSSSYAAMAIPALVANGVVMLLEAWSVTDDLNSRRQRFWIHWVGILLAITGTLLTFGGVGINLLR